jgi:integrase
LGEPPTINVDWYKETPRAAVIAVADLPAWWLGVQSTENPIRRDFYIWLLFTGCRREESATLRWDQIDLDAGTVHFSKTKTDPFDLPLSDFLIDLLSTRRADEGTLATFGEDCPWVFPSTSKTGHLAEAKLSAREAKTIPVRFSPHLLRHTYITISENKVSIPSGHARLLVNHALPASGDAHAGYNHPDMNDLRRSQQAMTDFLRSAIWTEPEDESDNVVPLHQGAG